MATSISTEELLNHLGIIESGEGEGEFDDAWDLLKYVNASHRDALPELVNALSSNDDEAKCFAIESIARIGGMDNEVARMICGLALTSTFLPVRQCAIAALPAIAKEHDIDATSIITTVLSEQPNLDGLKYLSYWALHKITGSRLSAIRLMWQIRHARKKRRRHPV